MGIKGSDKNTQAEIEAGVNAATDIDSLLADVGDASASTLGSLYAILGNPGVDNFTEVIGQLLDAAIAMNVASDGTQTTIELLRAILERIGETPADPDDSLHTIAGQRDATALDKNTNDDGTQSHTALLRSLIDRIGNVGSSDISTKVDAVEALLLPKRVIKTVAFDGGAGSGAVGSVALFTVTGGVDYSIEIFCTETLVDAANLATISLGTAASTAQIIAVTGAAGQGGTTIAINEIWHDIAPDASTELTSDASKEFTSYGEDIIYTIAGEAITDGTLVASIIYTPRTSGGLVEAA